MPLYLVPHFIAISIALQKEDADNFKGRLMGMFDVKGSRVK